MTLSDTIYQNLRDAILSGTLQPGDRIPSIREAARERSCNKLTVKKAYDRLRAEELIENSVGRGSFVAYPRRIGEEQGAFSFQIASMGESFFPADQLRQRVDHLFAETGSRLFAAVPPGGDAECRRALASFYRVPAERMLIISGAQQGLDLVGRLFPHSMSDAVLFEDPTYSGALNLFRPRRFVPLGSEGPDLDQLRLQAEEGIEAFYTMPQIHNPTGISCSRKRMEEIGELAERYNFFIIEDDYLSEFLPGFFDDPPLRYLDLVPERCIHIKSLSKLTAPGVRIGFLIAPAKLREDLLFNKFTADVGTGSFMQHLLRDMIEQGLLRQSVETNRIICSRRREEVERLLASFSFLHFSRGLYGYNSWVHSDLSPLIPGAPWAKGENFSFDPRYRSFFRLSFMGLSDRRFSAGLEYLRELFLGMSRERQGGIF